MPTIRAKPYDFPFEKNHLALIIIDMQRDFVEPGGFGAALGNDVSLLAPIIPTIAKLLAVFRKLKLTVIHTKECHKPDLSDCPAAKLERGHGKLRIGDVGPMGRILIDGEPGNDFVPSLRPLGNELVIAKPGKGAFYATNLEGELKKLGITHLLFTGVTTEVCVQTTMREANDRGYEALLVEDGTESYFAQFKQATLDMVRAQNGIVGWTAATEQVIDALS